MPCTRSRQSFVWIPMRTGRFGREMIGREVLFLASIERERPPRASVAEPAWAIWTHYVSCQGHPDTL